MYGTFWRSFNKNPDFQLTSNLFSGALTCHSRFQKMVTHKLSVEHGNRVRTLNPVFKFSEFDYSRGLPVCRVHFLGLTVGSHWKVYSDRQHIGRKFCKNTFLCTNNSFCFILSVAFDFDCTSYRTVYIYRVQRVILYKLITLSYLYCYK